MKVVLFVRLEERARRPNIDVALSGGAFAIDKIARIQQNAIDRPDLLRCVLDEASQSCRLRRTGTFRRDFHGDCVKIDDETAKNIEWYDCVGCKKATSKTTVYQQNPCISCGSLFALKVIELERVCMMCFPRFAGTPADTAFSSPAL